MVERRLQISLAATTVLATLMLGLAQRNPIVVLIGVFAGVTSVLFTDIYRWMVLDRRVSYLAMIGAAAISLNGFMRNSSEAQLLAIANMLIVVQVALLYQEKSVRVYSHLAVFSVLQVVVAALLQVDALFSVFLTVYVAVGSYAVILFSMHRESIRLERIQERREPFSFLGEIVPVKKEEPEPTEWRQALGEGITCDAARSHRESAADVFRLGQSSHLLAMAGATVAFAVFFFYFSPRLVQGDWSQGSGVGKVGFAPKITFRSLHRMIESNDRVMRASFSRFDNNEPYPLFGAPYFRGAALTTYTFNAADPTWFTPETNNVSWKDLPKLKSFGENVELVRQEYWLHPSHDDQLFAVPAFYRDPAAPDWVNMDRANTTLKVNSPDSLRANEIRRYSVITTGLQAASQTNITPQFSNNPRITQSYIERTLVDFNEAACPTIHRVSSELLAKDGWDRGRIYQAQVLMRHLLTDEFEYTLDTGRIRDVRDPKIDPVEDFFANHKIGFCAHFASALALMLRSQKIPARVVVGYHGGEYNDMGDFYVVRSRDAHAWVEAYLRPKDLEGIADAANRDIESPAGAWLRLDPTPGEVGEDYDKGVMNYVDQFLDYTRSLWSDYVLGLNRNPNASMGPSRAARRQKTRTLRERLSELLPNWGWTWLGSVPIIGMLCVAVWRLSKAFSIFPWARKSNTRKRRKSPIDFYNRLEKAAKRGKLQRPPDQTPREFAGVMEQFLRSNEVDGADIQTLHMVVNAFYDARFGGRPLDSAETEAIEQALSRLEASFSVGQA